MFSAALVVYGSLTQPVNDNAAAMTMAINAFIVSLQLKLAREIILSPLTSVLLIRAIRLFEVRKLAMPSSSILISTPYSWMMKS